MAILGINPEHGTLREAQDYSYMLAELVYCVRVISLELLLPSKNGDLRGIPEIQIFFVERMKYLQDGSMGMLPCMISLFAYGKNIAMDYGNVGSVFWAEGNRVMLTDGMSPRKRGNSFIDHKEKSLESQYFDVTLPRLLQLKNGKKMRRDGKWHPPLAADYLLQVDKFRKLLLFYVHVTGGQSARGTEVFARVAASNSGTG
ncbi:hypothetical protein E4U59_006071 [Claviceps monticola]|nr:hypothetical protein E4U59_006071 [Claviceps monticola]